MTIRWTYCVLNFVWFRQPCPETDLGDGCTGIESEYFSKRHAEDKMRKKSSVSTLLYISAVRIPARPGKSWMAAVRRGRVQSNHSR